MEDDKSTFLPSSLEMVKGIAQSLNLKFSDEEWPIISELFDIAIKEGLDFGTAMRWAVKTYYGWE